MATARKRGRAAVTAREQYLRMHPLCLHCERRGRITAAAEVDHIIPLHEGGSDDDSNKQALCQPCHKDKTARDMGYVARGADLNGCPISATHPWNSPPGAGKKSSR